MKEIQEKIEQIMQQFNDKQEEIRKLINANADEKANTEAALKEAEQKRKTERSKTIDKQLALGEIMESLLGQNIIDSDITINGKPILNPEEKEKELIDKIEKLNDKERELERLKNQLTNLRANKEKLIEKYSTYDEEYSDKINNSFESTSRKLENKLISDINALTLQVSQKHLLVSELQQIKSSKANKEINSLFVQKSLELFFKDESEELAKKGKALLNESQEEKELNKKIKEIEKRPNYTNVYLREMFEIKYEFHNLIMSEKITLESLLKSKNELRQDIVLQFEREKDEKMTEYNSICDKRKELAEIVLDLTDKLSVNQEAEDDYKTKTDELLSLIKKEKSLKEKIDQMSADTNDLDLEIDNIQQLLSEIIKHLESLQFTEKEKNAYSMTFNDVEQTEYSRRLIIKNQEKIAQQQAAKFREEQRIREVEEQTERRIREEQEKKEQQMREEQEQKEQAKRKAEELLKNHRRSSKDAEVDQIVESQTCKRNEQTTFYRGNNNPLDFDFVEKLRRQKAEEIRRAQEKKETKNSNESLKDAEVEQIVTQNSTIDAATTFYREDKVDLEKKPSKKPFSINEELKKIQTPFKTNIFEGITSISTEKISVELEQQTKETQKICQMYAEEPEKYGQKEEASEEETTFTMIDLDKKFKDFELYDEKNNSSIEASKCNLIENNTEKSYDVANVVPECDLLDSEDDAKEYKLGSYSGCIDYVKEYELGSYSKHKDDVKEYTIGSLSRRAG